MAPVQQTPADLTLNKYSLEYSFEELDRATKGFHDTCKLGSGGFGAVYRGTQSDGTDIAVKVLELPEEAGFEEEVRVLSKFRHPNLVILMGFARRGGTRALVYELLGGGDLHRRLERCAEGELFPWRQRASAAFDAACGLSHLHNSSLKVFHRDIKSPNILLDRNGTAKVADFGLACLSHAKAHRVENAAGTIGYACPVYARRHVVTEGSEVYSFGVVLLELLTSSPPAWIVRSPDGSRRYEFLAGVIRGDAGIAMSLADPGAAWPQHVANAMAELALYCTLADDERRPGFTEVVNLLRAVRDAPDVLQQPSEQQVPQSIPGSAQMLQEEGMAVQQGTMKIVEWTSVEVPKLWSLECEYVEGLDAVPPEHSSVVHWLEPGVPLLALFKVGRLAQEDFFKATLADDFLRNMVSREHFQIWATQAGGEALPSTLAPGCVPCSFYIANLSRSWTMVNGTLLDAPGKYSELRHDDTIAIGRKLATAEGVRYSPLMCFRFDLSGSVLREAAPREVSEAQPC